MSKEDQTKAGAVLARGAWVGAFLVIALVISIAGYWFYRTKVTEIREQRRLDIAIIGELKANSIQDWLKERRADAESIVGHPSFRQLVMEIVGEVEAPAARELIREGLIVERDSYGYTDVLLIDPGGEIILSALDERPPVPLAVLRAGEKSALTGRGEYSDLFSTPHDEVHLGTVAAILDEEGDIVAYLVLEGDAGSFLYPVIRAWPSPSATAESFLVQQFGGEVVLLNKVRHRDDPPLTIRFPLTDEHLPAVQAVLGTGGVVEGRDYRDARVLADLRPIEGTPWYMVTKIDLDEIMREARYSVGIIGPFFLLLILFAGSMVAYLYQQRELHAHQNLYRAERQLGDVRRLLTETQVISRLGGWTHDVATGETVWTDQLYDIFGVDRDYDVADVDRTITFFAPGYDQAIRNAFEKAIRDGVAYDLEVKLIRADGKPIWLRAIGNPVLENGKVVRVTGTLMDITDRREAEHARRESEIQYRVLADSGHALIWTCGPDGNRDYFNQPWLDFTGRTMEQETGHGWAENIHPDDRTACIDAYTKALESRTNIDMTYRLRRRGGEYRWIHDAGMPRFDARGQFAGYIGHCLDITNMKRTEDALRKSEERFAQLARISRTFVWEVDADGLYTFVSDVVEDLLGYCPVELVGKKHFYDLAHEEDREAVKASGLEAIQSNLPLTRYENRLVAKDGRVLWVMSGGAAVLNADGTVRGYRGSDTDITAQKQAEAAIADQARQLREVHERLNYHLDNTPLAMIEWDSDGRVSRWSRQAQEIFGWKEEEVLGLRRGDWPFIYPEDAGKISEVMDSVITGPESRHVSINRNLTKDGEVVYSEWHNSFRRDAQGKVVSSLSLVHNISRRIKAEMEGRKLREQLLQAQKMDAVGRLAGGVAHDFNNMLNVILGHAELMLLTLGPEDEHRQEIEEIFKAGQRSADLVRQLLAFARKQAIAPRRMDLSETVEGMLKMLRRLIGENIELIWRPSPGIGHVRMDPAQVDQILVNLVLNSRDAIEHNGRIVIETDRAEFDEEFCADRDDFTPGRFVVLSVSDDGSGMDKETLEHIFEPFFTTKEGEKGTGLGLPTVYGIVKQNKGFVTVYSEPGEGTTIKTYIPRDESFIADEKHPLTPTPVPHGKETILLVEDEPSVLELTRVILERLGYSVIATDSSEKGADLAREHRDSIDLLMSDVVMPGMSGRELRDSLREVLPGIKCLFTSGYTADVIARHGVLDEGIYFLQKPYSREALANKLRKVLDGG